MDIKKLVDDMTFSNQEALLKELVDRERIAVHVASREETVSVDDVYDNSSSHQKSISHESNGVLTIIYIDHKLALDN